MEIKDELFLDGMTWAVADDTENNKIGAFQTSNSNTPGYYIVQCTVNANTLQVKYTCHAFNTSVIITEGELFFPAKFWTLISKYTHWYHNPDEEIPVMVKLKQVVMPYIDFLTYKNITNKFPSRFKDTLVLTLIYYLNRIIKSYWIKLKEEKILIMSNMWRIKITTM